jgi:hypothetical protein
VAARFPNKSTIDGWYAPTVDKANSEDGPRYEARRLLNITEPENLSALIKEAAKTCLTEKEVLMLEKYLNKANMTEQDGKLVHDYIKFASRREGLLMEAWRQDLIDAGQQASILDQLAIGETLDVKTLEKKLGILMKLTLGDEVWNKFQLSYDQFNGGRIARSPTGKTKLIS